MVLVLILATCLALLVLALLSILFVVSTLILAVEFLAFFVGIFGFLIILLLVLKAEGSAFCVLFLSFDLFALATVTGLLGFAVSYKLGHAAAVLACAPVLACTAVVLEDFSCTSRRE